VQVKNNKAEDMVLIKIEGY